jgi:hypothetical protein
MADAKKESEKQDWRVLAARLREVPASSRKLLVHIVELAYRGSREGRQQDTAYLPELHESCGLDVEAMYETLQPLQRAGLIELENQYPFEDIRLVAAGDSGEKLLPALSHFCERGKTSLHDVIVDLRFDRLQ